MTLSKGCDILSVSTFDMISDHFSLVADMKILTDYVHTVPQTIPYRKLQTINIAAFKDDMKSSELIKYPETKATELAKHYYNVLNTLIDHYSMLVTIRSHTGLPTHERLWTSWFQKIIIDFGCQYGLEYFLRSIC